jgi:hypothetical protein
MTKDEIDRFGVTGFAHQVDNPELAKQHGMVTQVWNDGEITYQKSGDLLWQRTLHMDCPAIPGAEALGLEFPHKHGSNSYAFVTSHDAHKVRAAIWSLLHKDDDQLDPYRPYTSRKPEGENT